MKLFGLSSFALEVLVQIYVAEILGQPIEKSHGWLTARGNSIDVIWSELISRCLIREEGGYFLTEDDGKKVVLLIMAKIEEEDKTLIGKLRRRIRKLEKEKMPYQLVHTEGGLLS